MTKTSFNQKCYEAICSIPKGRITTYAEIAHFLGNKAYRAVGNAMAKNPNAPQVPCHRVVNSNGRIGNYAFGQDKKVELLRQEGIEIVGGKVINLQKYLHNLSTKQ